jgi:hypothetical protein
VKKLLSHGKFTSDIYRVAKPMTLPHEHFPLNVSAHCLYGISQSFGMKKRN